MLKVEHVEKLNVVAHFSLVKLAFRELNEANLLSSQNSGGLNYDLEAITATQDDLPIGFIAFCVEKWNRSIDIHMAYVSPEHRRRGVHTAMFEKLIEHGKNNNIVKIDSSTHANNLAAQKAFAKQGRIHISNNYTFPLVDWIKQ